MKLPSIFKTNKPIIGMLHIDDLEGPGFKSVDYLVKRAKKDIKGLQDGGIDAILIENWKEDTVGEFVSEKTKKRLKEVVGKIVGDIKVPYGFNILNNDYKVALELAKEFGADFVELDVFVDHVRSNFVHSPIASKNPFEIRINPQDVLDYAKSIGAEDIPIIVFVQPKHYTMLDENKSIEESTKQAFEAGASGVLVTKETGTAPTVDLIKKAKKVADGKPVGIGSGLSIENAKTYLSVADFAIVGTSLKQGNNADNPVDPKKVKAFMKKVEGIRRV